MTLWLHNTLTGRREEFVPLEPGVARMYTCGPTVYDHQHIGNYRTMLFFDLLRRHLQVSSYRVVHVLNITDVDDRIIDRANRAGVTIGEYTRPYEESFFDGLRALRAQPAEFYPRATGHIEEMIVLIEQLLERGHAYRSEDGVYYRIASFPDYGALSGLDRQGLRVGARVAADDYDKESATDFALWKRAGPADERVGAAWDASFGRGRPGWHIECSAMSMRYLGKTFDIHSGGIDLLFPHHENEIAQSEAATGRQFSRYWVHTQHVTAARGEKMSKRLGNTTFLKDVLAAGHEGAAVRMFLMANAHYRQQLAVSEDELHSAAERVRRLRDLADRLHRLDPAEIAGSGNRTEGRGVPPSSASQSPSVRFSSDDRLVQLARTVRQRYRASLDDDLNLAQGIGYIFELVREANTALDRGTVGVAGRRELLRALDDVDAHLDVLRVEEEVLDADVERKIAERDEARSRKDYGTADRIREELAAVGIQLEDTAQGVRWRRSSG